MKNPLIQPILTGVALTAALAVLHFQPWNHPILPVASAQKHQDIAVGFLPVTCHLTCPVTDYATKTSAAANHFESRRFTDFPTVVDALKSERIQATFMIVPLAMKLREQGVPVKIVYLGHRDGSEIVVAKNNPTRDLRGLRGKTFAIPSKYSNQYLVVRALMQRQNVAPDEIKFVELAPPDMPGALATGAIDAYFVGEPFAAKAEMDKTGRVLYYAKDIWPHFISCALVVHEKMIAERPEVVRDLVRGIAQSGEWAETHRLEAAKIAAPFFRQKESLVRYVLTTPPDRVSYRMLTPTNADLQEIADAALQSGILKKPVSMRDLIDREFVPKTIEKITIPAP